MTYDIEVTTRRGGSVTIEVEAVDELTARLEIAQAFPRSEILSVTRRYKGQSDD